MSQHTRTFWQSHLRPEALVVLDDSVMVVSERSVIALDDSGAERWRRSYARAPRRIVQCGGGVAFDLSDRTAPTQVIALDLSGNEMWRYDRRWGLLFDGLAGDARGIVLYGQDSGASTSRWVGLEASDGAVGFDVPSPVEGAPKLAGVWLLGLIADGESGVLRLDRQAAKSTTLTSLGISAWAATDEVLLINTIDEPAQVVAIELASGRERWRASGGNNLEIAICDGRASWVERGDAGARPVVHDLAAGRRIWNGDPLPAIDPADSYACRLGPSALVCYCGHEHVAYYSLATAAPLSVRGWARDAPSASQFSRAMFLEGSFHGLTCMELA